MNSIPAAIAAGPKTNVSGNVNIVDDLMGGSGGSVGLQGGSAELSGSLGQIGTESLSAVSVDLEAGFFSRLVSTPASAGYQTVYFSSIVVIWSDGVPGNPLGTMYEIQVSTSSSFPAALTSVIFTQGFTATFQNLTSSATYFARIQASYMEGDESEWAVLPSTFTPPENIPPTITDLQSGDDAWRRTNVAAYSTQFDDTGGSHLSHFQVQASTELGGSPVLSPFTNVVSPGSLFPSNSVSTTWSLPSSVFAALLPGVTNYMTVQVFDMAGNSTTLTNAFYVKVDTAAPGILNNVPLALQEVWRNADPGAIYGALLSDEASGVDTLQYSASRNAGTADQGVSSWTTVAANLNALSVAPGFSVNFAGLADSATNYISLRAWDVAGSTRVLVDAFKVWKDTTGPAVAVTVPTPGGFRSALTSVSGTAADAVSLRGSEISIRDATNGSYWDAATSGFNSASPVFYPVQGGASWSSGAIGIGWINGNSYSLIARSSDAAGNYSASNATATFAFDTTAPTAGIVVPSDGASVSNLAAISGTAADPNVGPGPGPAAGVASVQIRFRRLSDGLWWNFFSESWSTIQVSSAAGGTDSWVHSPSALLQANLASNASYFITAAAGDFAEPPNQASFFAVGTTFTFVDNTPPAAVSDLSATPTTTPGELVVRWAAPGDDGNSGIILLGQYAIGYATFSAASFSTAAAQVVFSTAVVVPGTLHSRLVTSSSGLSPGTTYFLAVFTRDDAGNWSAVSNIASARTAFTPPNSITGHVVNLSTQGITGVLMNAYNPDGSLASTTYTLNDGSGTYALAGLSSGAYVVEAVWTANGLTSSIWKDGIAMGSFNVDFVLTVSYTLASITGQMFALESGGAASGAAAYRARAAARSSANGYVELFQNGRRIAVSGVNADGRFTVANLLPGRYSLRGYNGLAFTPLIDVSLLEGEVREVSLVWDPLPEASVYAFPNPARDRTTLRFETNVAGPEAQILVFDITGALVREISGSEMTSPQLGLYHANWDLTNQRGEAVVSGVYLFLVKVRSAVTGQVAQATKKLAVVR